MPGAAIVGAALNTGASRAFGLWVGGVDVIADPVAPADYWVPIESVHIMEAGPGAVSSMEFTIECATALPVTVADGMDVRFWRTSGNYPLFLGFVDHVDISNMPGDIGTRYQVQAVGIEAVLDWSLIAADFTIPAATTSENAVLSCVSASIGNALGWLNAFASTSAPISGISISIQAQGITSGVAATLNAAVAITAGTTLREAIRQVSGQVTTPTTGTFAGESIVLTTVDLWGGLRWYIANAQGGMSLIDAGLITIDDDPPLTQYQAEPLAYGIDASQVRGVLVKGTGVTVFVGDGTGKPGGIALLADANITTQAAAQSAGVAYLAPYLSSARGSFTLQDFDPVGAPFTRAGYSSINFTDSRVVSGIQAFLITGIDKTWNASQRENWTVSFGGLPPSVTDLMRQLTRGTLS